MSVIITQKSSIRGTIYVPGDKSIAHRAVLAAALSEGDTKISHFIRCADTVSTIFCLQKMGISVEDLGNSEILIHGKGLYGLSKPEEALNVGNSGTTSRLLTGILTGQPFDCELRGDDSLQKRSMSKVITPLVEMGANIIPKNGKDTLPLTISGTNLHGTEYESPSVSAQIKSAILFAGLYADSPTTIFEPFRSRNHTERVLRHFGASIVENETSSTIIPGSKLIANDITIPGDLSSAAFMIAAALVLPDSELMLKNVCINESRMGFINIIQQMGGNIRFLNAQDGIEPCTDILVTSSHLHGITIEKDIIPSAIDELPILSVLACFAEGTTVITDATELKFKETNRIDALVENLSRMGADISAQGNEIVINGGMPLHGSIVGSRLDHRIAMCMAIAGTLAPGSTEIIGSDCVKVSYPGFYKDLEQVSVE